MTEARERFDNLARDSRDSCDNSERSYVEPNSSARNRESYGSLAQSNSEPDDMPAQRCSDSFRRSYRRCCGKTARSRWACSYPVWVGRHWMAHCTHGLVPSQLHSTSRSVAKLLTMVDYLDSIHHSIPWQGSRSSETPAAPAIAGPRNERRYFQSAPIR